MAPSTVLPCRLSLTTLLLACSLIAGCGRSQELEACNIAELNCQEDIYYALVRMRGDGFDPYDGVPPIRMLTWKEYQAELFPPQPPPPPAEPPPDPPPPPPVDPWDQSLQWLGLLAPSVPSGQAASEDFLNRVAAFYTWGTQTVTVVLDPNRTERNDRGDTILLAHELVHAFQDNESDVTPSDGTIDGNFAANTLIEGEARLYEWLTAFEVDGYPARRYDFDAFFDGDVKHHRNVVAGAKSRFYATWVFMYSLGGDASTKAWMRGGNAAVRELTRTAPRSSIEYIARHEGFEIEDAPALVCQLQLPAETFQLVRFDRFGALHVFGFLIGAGLTNDEAWEATREFRDDRIMIYFDMAAQKVAVTWRLRFADKDTADWVAGAARTRPMLRAERFGRDVVITGSEADLADWPGATDCE